MIRRFTKTAISGLEIIPLDITPNFYQVSYNKKFVGTILLRKDHSSWGYSHSKAGPWKWGFVSLHQAEEALLETNHIGIENIEASAKKKKTLYPKKIAPVEYDNYDREDETTQTPITSLPASFIPAPFGYQNHAPTGGLKGFTKTSQQYRLEPTTRKLENPIYGVIVNERPIGWVDFRPKYNAWFYSPLGGTERGYGPFQTSDAAVQDLIAKFKMQRVSKKKKKRKSGPPIGFFPSIFAPIVSPGGGMCCKGDLKGFTKKAQAVETPSRVWIPPEVSKVDIDRVEEQLHKVRQLIEENRIEEAKDALLLADVFLRFIEHGKQQVPESFRPKMVFFRDTFEELKTTISTAEKAGVMPEKGKESFLHVIQKTPPDEWPKLLSGQVEGYDINRVNQDVNDDDGLMSFTLPSLGPSMESIKWLSEQDFYDFYAISLMLPHIHGGLTPGWQRGAGRVITNFVQDMAQNIVNMAKVACIGELSHYVSKVNIKKEKQGAASSISNNIQRLQAMFGSVKEFINKAYNNEISWEQIGTLYRDPWTVGPYGGKAWADIAKEAQKLEAMLPVTLSNLKKVVAQVDHVIDLEHNSELFLNWFTTFGQEDPDYETDYSSLAELLDDKSKNWDLKFLAQKSPQMYTIYQNLQRSLLQHKSILKGFTKTAKEAKIKPFYLDRQEDETGISGTGRVAYGLVLPSGRAVIEWTTGHPSITIFNSTDELLAVHGHDGKTKIKYLKDTEASEIKRLVKVAQTNGILYEVWVNKDSLYTRTNSRLEATALLQRLKSQGNKDAFISQTQKGSLKTACDKIPGGLAEGKSPEDFDQKDLAEGVKSEMEHTTDKEIAQEIAMDHLVEDPKYYQKLKKMEKKEAQAQLEIVFIKGFMRSI